MSLGSFPTEPPHCNCSFKNILKIHSFFKIPRCLSRRGVNLGPASRPACNTLVETLVCLLWCMTI
uniref:Uncharacterized protein n=1 Tax=Anguilla anguilla TaxID=7936 RepID=A0A0E9XWG7_ANGAN